MIGSTDYIVASVKLVNCLIPILSELMASFTDHEIAIATGRHSRLPIGGMVDYNHCTLSWPVAGAPGFNNSQLGRTICIPRFVGVHALWDWIICMACKEGSTVSSVICDHRRLILPKSSDNRLSAQLCAGMLPVTPCPHVLLSMA